ncbi:MAG: hypothetical protein IKQ45_07910 [Clostridia bacterium]|nr:hypothetical protein [Clostridia bacterium]
MKLNGKNPKGTANTSGKNKTEDAAVKAKTHLSDEEAGTVTGAGDWLELISGDPVCDSCPEKPTMNIYREEGNLITYICPICQQTITLFDQG